MFADDNSIFDENGRKIAKWEENAMGKGKITCLRAISFLPTVFPKDVKTRACLGKGQYPASALTETSSLYTEGHMDKQTDKLIPVYPRKHSLCGDKNIFPDDRDTIERQSFYTPKTQTHMTTGL